MGNVIDDFDSVMNQVMKEIEDEERKLDNGVFSDVVEYRPRESSYEKNNFQSEADKLLKEDPAPARSIKTNNSNGSGSFSVDMEGVMGVDLKLKFGDKELFLSCDEEQLIIRLADGSSFSIPFKGKADKAA